MAEISHQDLSGTVKGLEGLASHIAEVYKGHEEKLEKIILQPMGFSTKDWIYDYLDDLAKNGQGNSILRFLQQIPVLDPLAVRLGIDIYEIEYERKPPEILKRLGISEHRTPLGIQQEINVIHRLEKRLNKMGDDYEGMLGLGSSACERLEHILKMLISFYGGFCFENTFLSFLQVTEIDEDVLTILDSEIIPRMRDGVDIEVIRETLIREKIKNKLIDVSNKEIPNNSLKNGILDFLARRRSADLGTLINLLRSLDNYTNGLKNFREIFEKESLCSLLAQPSISAYKSGKRPTRKREKRTKESEEVFNLLEELREDRNKLIHDKHGKPTTAELCNTRGLRPHLAKIFKAFKSFERIASKLNLFPLSGQLIQKFEKVNLNPHLEMLSENAEHIYIPRERFDSYILGAEYFYWSKSARISMVSPVVLKKFS